MAPQRKAACVFDLSPGSFRSLDTRFPVSFDKLVFPHLGPIKVFLFLKLQGQPTIWELWPSPASPWGLLTKNPHCYSPALCLYVSSSCPERQPAGWGQSLAVGCDSWGCWEEVGLLRRPLPPNTKPALS